MTTLIPKFDFKNGGSTPVESVNRPINEKLSDWVSVKDFGAIGDGVADDTVAIQAAIDYVPNGLVYIPVGTYKISDSIQIKGSILGTGLATVIQPTTDTFAAFVNNGTAIAKFSIKGLFINYGVATGDTRSSNSASAGFYFNNDATNNLYPYEFKIEEIWIRYAYNGIKDSSYSYMFTLENVRIDWAVNGFYFDSFGSTTANLVNCYTTDTTGYAYYFFEVNGLSIESSAFDRANNTVSGNNLFYCTDCSGININSFDFEANTIGYSYSAAFAFDFCLGVAISGLRGYQNTYATGSTEVYGILFTRGAFGNIEGVTIGATNDTSTGTGAVSVVMVQQASSITIDSCRLVAPTGTSGAKYSIQLTGSSVALITQNNNSFTDNVVDNTSKLVNNQIPLISANNGDADANIAVGQASTIQLYNTPLTTTRAVYIAPLGVYQGAQVTVVRTAAATGASGLQIYDQGTSTVIKTLAVGQWATVTYSSGWFVTSTGSL